MPAREECEPFQHSRHRMAAVGAIECGKQRKNGHRRPTDRLAAKGGDHQSERVRLDIVGGRSDFGPHSRQSQR